MIVSSPHAKSKPTLHGSIASNSIVPEDKRVVVVEKVNLAHLRRQRASKREIGYYQSMAKWSIPLMQSMPTRHLQRVPAR